jgi:hypothetical protein
MLNAGLAEINLDIALHLPLLDEFGQLLRDENSLAVLDYDIVLARL